MKRLLQGQADVVWVMFGVPKLRGDKQILAL
jgi:hypothetical protein